MGFSGDAYVFLEPKGKPYSAQQEWEETYRWDTSDKPVRRFISARVYRDSEGRTRTEQSVFALMGEDRALPLLIDIVDSVAGCKYTLDTERHVAHRVKAVPSPDGMGGGQLTPERAALLRNFMRAPHPPPPPPPPPANNGSRGESTQESASISFDPVPIENVTKEDLATQRMEGVTVKGHRTTTLMPSDGSGSPSKVTNESWFSPDIQEFVVMKTISAHGEESASRLTHVVLGEPDAALFHVPPDYQIVDETGPFQII